MAQDEYAVIFIYEYPPDAGKTHSSIFTPHTVQAMCEHEATVTFHPLYKQYCVLDTQTKTCAEQPTSIVRYFYSPQNRNPAAGGCQLLDAAEVEERASVVLSNLRASINGFFVNEAAVEGGYTNATRSLIQFGSPLAGFQVRRGWGSGRLDGPEVCADTRTCGRYRRRTRRMARASSSCSMTGIPNGCVALVGTT